MAYTSFNGTCSVFCKEGWLALRLSIDARAFLKKYHAKLCERYGLVMKEYVQVPDTLLRKLASCESSST